MAELSECQKYQYDKYKYSSFLRFIPKWSRAVRDADNSMVKNTIPEYEHPQYLHNARIKYFKDLHQLDFSLVIHGVVTEAHEWNGAYFRRDNPKDFCQTCNTLEKEESYIAVTKGKEHFEAFKHKLHQHMWNDHWL